MTDNLDQLTDAELDEVFAVEVAGWTVDKSLCDDPQCHMMHESICGPEGESITPHFSTSMDALMPWLETMDDATITRLGPRWLVQMLGGVTETETNSLPRAVCIALIRANRQTLSKP